MTAPKAEGREGQLHRSQTVTSSVARRGARSRTHLPSLDCLGWINQHYNLQQQTVLNPDEQDQLERDKHDERTAEAETSSNDETKDATEDVSERVNDCVAVVTQSGRFFPIPIDYELSIFKDFPGGLDSYCNQKLPIRFEARREPREQPEKHEAVKHVCEGIGIEEVLRVVRTARIAGPDQDSAARADPQPSFQVEQKCSDSKHRNERK
jgi:hypothetical protein